MEYTEPAPVQQADNRAGKSMQTHLAAENQEWMVALVLNRKRVGKVFFSMYSNWDNIPIYFSEPTNVPNLSH